MKTIVEHLPDHDVIHHQLDADDRHAAALWITEHLVPKIAAGWAVAEDHELAYEVRRLAAEPRSELNTLLLNLVTDEQARRAALQRCAAGDHFTLGGICQHCSAHMASRRESPDMWAWLDGNASPLERQ